MAQEEKNQGGGTLVFVRHGQSIWNATNQFTGWVDCDLSEVGVQEAHEGGKELAKAGVEFDIMYTSYQKRAIKTGDIVLEELDQLWIPVVKSWRLNERMYGALQGLNKKETVDKHGEKKKCSNGDAVMMFHHRKSIQNRRTILPKKPNTAS